MSDHDLIRRGDVLRVVYDALTYSSGQAAFVQRRIRALPAVQPDAAAILQERPDSLDRVARAICLASYGAANPVPVPDELMPNAWERLRDRYALLAEAAILALIDNSGKEVMPDERPVRVRQTDTGSGDQAVAGAADYPALREAIHKMVGLYETGDRSTYSACPQSAVSAIAFLDDYEARNCPAPKLLVDDCDIALTWEVGGWKLYQYCDAEESISFRWIGTPIAARPEPVAPPPPWPDGLIHLTNTRDMRCTTEGCGRRVSTRFEGRDYCEPCGRQVAGAAQPDKINWRDDPDAIVEDDEPQIGRDYA
jgi:hypothetical protein